jgi:hypothetical protein
VRSWPLLVLALPATVAVWSGWVGIGQMTGFGQVHPLPGIWDSLHLDTAITLPVGVEAYAAYALRAWLSASAVVSARTRRFARWSAIGSLLLGMADQIAYHLPTQAQTTHAPWASPPRCPACPSWSRAWAPPPPTSSAPTPAEQTSGANPAPHTPVRRLARTPAQITPPYRSGQSGSPGATATTLNAAGQRVSRRSLRCAGERGSNAELGAVARLVTSQLASQGE